MILNIHIVQKEEHQNYHNSPEYATGTTNNLNHCMVLDKQHIENRIDGTYKYNDDNSHPFLGLVSLVSYSWIYDPKKKKVSGYIFCQNPGAR